MGKLDQATCLRYVRSLFPSMTVSLFTHQGGCSMTLLVTGEWADDTRPWQSRLVQLRLEQFALDMGLAEAAVAVHGDLAPHVREHAWLCLKGKRIQVLEMPVLPGIRANEVRPRQADLDAAACAGMQRLLSDLAQTFADAWHRRDCSKTCSGRVGVSIRLRLDQLSQKLPRPHLRELAYRVLTRVQHGELDELPIVLTHGDMLPSNILVGEQSWALLGLVDWAEAEYLPFGIAMYGVEHLLGFIESDPCHGRGPTFRFYHAAGRLYRRFWIDLRRLIPELAQTSMLEAVRLARDVGVLLWHGFAWDEGKIDRVVNDESDAQEVAYLEAFLACNHHSKL